MRGHWLAWLRMYAWLVVLSAYPLLPRAVVAWGVLLFCAVYVSLVVYRVIGSVRIMSILSRDAILDFDSGDPIPVEAFGGTVYVKPLSGTDRDAYEQSNIKQTRGGTTKLDLTNARARLVQLCAVDKDSGKRLFGKADIERLGKLPAVELDKVAEVARDASGLSSEDEDESVESFDGVEPELVGAPSS